jgi:hypothetical protein
MHLFCAQRLLYVPPMTYSFHPSINSLKSVWFVLSLIFSMLCQLIDFWHTGWICLFFPQLHVAVPLYRLTSTAFPVPSIRQYWYARKFTSRYRTILVTRVPVGGSRHILWTCCRCNCLVSSNWHTVLSISRSNGLCLDR